MTTVTRLFVFLLKLSTAVLDRMWMKVLCHPAHGKYKWCIVGNYTCFSFLKKLGIGI